MSLQPNELLKIGKKNYQILNSEVTKIELKKQTRWVNPKIIIYTQIKNYTFLVHASDAKNMDAHTEDFCKIFNDRLINK